MSGLIERNAAINALGDMPEGDDEWSVGCRNQWEWDTEALVNLPSAEQMGWTPTSVRPPKEFEYVLVQLSWGYELTQYIPPRINPKHKDGYWGESDSVDYDYFDVVAWMPLPEPYGGEQNEAN